MTMTLRQFFRIVEMRTKIISVSTFSTAVLYTVYRTSHFDLLRFLLMAAAVLLVDMGTTAFNIYYDYQRGVDREDFEKEREKVLVYEGVPPEAALLAALSLFSGAVVFGLIIGLLTGLQVIAAGALSMAVGYFYTGGPYPISRTPVGEVFAGGFLGTVLFLITWFVTAGYLPDYPDLPVHAVLASLPSLFLIASILTVNNTCDIEGDKIAGRRTFSILFGQKAGETLVYILGLLGFGTAIVLGLPGIGVLPATSPIILAAVSIPTVLEYRTLHRRGYSQAAKAPSMGSISKIFMFYTLAMWLSLGIGIIF